ncbi:ribonuclease H-like domain-containing protein [Mycena crocata]|nr:ribonuclease H-like domain-containing protein [Mycena crocata]
MPCLIIPACAAAGSVRGDRTPWITHILGGRSVNPCSYASAAAKAYATSQKDASFAKKQTSTMAAAAPSSSTATAGTSASARKHARSVSVDDEAPAPKRLQQGVFQVFSGRDQPFTTAEAEAIQAQTLRATVSAGLAFRTFENREVLKLIGLFRTAGPEIMPSRKVIGGRLLDEAVEKVDVRVRHALQGRQIGLLSDGWRSRKKADVNALCANSEYKLVDMTGMGKDGPALCKTFMDMIDRVQRKYKCYVVFFTTDADGGSKKGRILLGKERPWLFVPSCWAHQFQLILGDYFKVFPYSAEIAEKATGLVSWLNNHGKVRKIFDAVQEQLSFDRVGRIIVLAYLVANMTRWTTHCVSFIRLLVLQEYLQFAVLQSRGAIVAAQVGQAKSTEAVKLAEEADYYCTLISSPEFWSGLTTVVADIEPICYGTNINQKDSTRADQVLLTLAGLYLHYVDHPEPEVSRDLVARIEKRWKDCDQLLFLVALILNPFEGLSCFGPRANFDHFKATALVLELYRRLMSNPENTDAEEEKIEKEAELTKAMFEYLSHTGKFQGWAAGCDWYRENIGTDPIAVWKGLAQSIPELATFALTILLVVVNQAGCERVFSDVKNTESPRRSRTGVAKLEKITKVNGGIKAEHLAEGVAALRNKRNNHKSVDKLLAVPRYRDLLEECDEEDEQHHRPLLVSSKARWRTELAKWIQDAQAAELDADDSDDEGEHEPEAAGPPRPQKIKKYVKMTLETLFRDVVQKPVTRFAKKELDREAALMEALAEAEEDARPDDGAIECSEDEYEP